MIVHTAIVPGDLNFWDDGYFDIAVIIDILRSTTTLLYAVKSGAKEIIPASSIQQALELAKKYETGTAILCGERNGIKAPGFDLGNSPFEYTPEAVSGKTLIFASTNGSVAMERSQFLAKTVILASLRNLSVVVDFIIKSCPKQIILVCAGKEGRMSLEDTYTAGRIFDMLANKSSAISADDGTAVAQLVYRRFGDDIGAVFESSIHGQYLSTQLGLWDDLASASEVDADDIMLEIRNEKIVLSKKQK